MVPDEWGPVMFACLAEHGIKPWEFGELTFPWLKVILDKGRTSESDEALAWKVRQARAMTKEFARARRGKI